MQIINAAGSYTLPTLTVIDGGSFEQRTQTSERAFAHGAISTGDNKIKSRTVSLKIKIVGTSQASHDTQLDALKAALTIGAGKLYQRSDRYINFDAVKKMSIEYESGYAYVRSNVKVELLACDPFTYSTTLGQSVTTVTESPTTITINNAGTADCPAVITIAASASCNNVVIANTTDSRSCTLTDTALTSGVSAIIDSKAGTVYRGTNNSINNFSGQFIRLLPRSNTLTYAGGNCTLTIDYIPRYL